MASVLHQITCLANQTLKQNLLKCTGQNGDFQKLRMLMSKLRSDDVKLDMNLVSDRYHKIFDSSAPVSCVEILKSPQYTIVMFILRNGSRLPLHDHPGMHGILKVIHGKVRITSYSIYENEICSPPQEIMTKIKTGFFRRPPRIIPTKICHNSEIFDAESDAQLLTPMNGNYHEIEAEEPTAFVDLLTPPYDSNAARDCHYYHDIGTSNTDETTIHWLMNIPPPSDFWCDSHPYKGPQISDKVPHK